MVSEHLLIDTNIISFMMKGDTRASLYLPHFANRILAISFVTVGELFFGAEKARWGSKKREQLETTLGKFIVVSYDLQIARKFAAISAHRERKGLPISWPDAWIAACAVRHQIPLVTHNAKDFRSIPDLRVITEPGNPALHLSD